MKIVLAARMPEQERADWWQALQQAMPDDEWVDAAGEEEDTPGMYPAWADADIAIVANPRPGHLATCSRLRLIQSLWAGVDRLLADATLPASVPLARMVDPAMSAAMAQAASWAVLSLHRHAFDYADQQARAEWRPLRQRRADEIAVLVLGLGEMGAAAARALAALGYAVTGWSARARGVQGVASRDGWAALPGLLGAADIVVNLLPLTPDTQHLFDRDRLARMRPGASLVNLARGGHVVEPDLLAALASGHLARAVLDVFDCEPLPPAHAFWSHPRITVWPHAAAWTDLRTAVGVVKGNVDAVRRGETPRHLVDRSRGY